MNQQLTAPRALTALMARRAVRMATIISIITACIITIVTVALVYFFSPWWWLLIVPFAPLFILFFIVRFIVLLLIRSIHPNNLTKEQYVAMNEFVDKVQIVLEARSMPVPLIVFICLKDIVLHRDIVTIKKLIQDTAGLKSQYEQIQKLF